MSIRSKLPPPSEDEEQIEFIKYLVTRGIKHTSIPNHTYNPYQSQQNHNKKLGLNKGLCDVLVALPGIGTSLGGDEAYTALYDLTGATGMDRRPEHLSR